MLAQPGRNTVELLLQEALETGQHVGGEDILTTKGPAGENAAGGGDVLGGAEEQDAAQEQGQARGARSTMERAEGRRHVHFGADRGNNVGTDGLQFGADRVDFSLVHAIDV